MMDDRSFDGNFDGNFGVNFDGSFDVNFDDNFDGNFNGNSVLSRDIICVSCWESFMNIFIHSLYSFNHTIAITG